MMHNHDVARHVELNQLSEVYCDSLDSPSNLSSQICIFGRAVKALRSGRSPLCGRGFESHRMHLLLK